MRTGREKKEEIKEKRTRDIIKTSDVISLHLEEVIFVEMMTSFLSRTETEFLNRKNPRMSVEKGEKTKERRETCPIM